MCAAIASRPVSSLGRPPDVVVSMFSSKVPEADAASGEFVYGVNQVLKATAQAAETLHQEGVSLAQCGLLAASAQGSSVLAPVK